MSPTVLWFRQDLRLQDNLALQAAVARGAPVVPVFIWDEPGEGRWAPGGASRWWLHRSLGALDAALRELGARLWLGAGESAAVLREVIQRTGAGAVYWSRRYEPSAVARDKAIETELVAAGLDARSFNAALLNEPWTITNKSGRPFQVFTPYWRYCLTLPVERPIKFGEAKLSTMDVGRGSFGCELAELGLEPKIAWAGGLAERWTPGEAGAAKRLTHFVRQAMDRYAEERDLPSVDGTAQLSPWLHFGEISPRQIWAAVEAAAKASGVFPPSNGARVFLSEVGWREFGYHLLFHFPQTAEQPLRAEFAAFPWAEDVDGAKLRAWQRGRTGYPIVDAGLRQLWATGWMHNRVRMIAGSFLVKHLRLPWQRGAEWFWDTLVDADLASNTLGWQWTAGCGADAAPYFRIFAPVLQGRKFDPDGEYVRRWVPELANMPAKFIHAPWEAPAEMLASVGVRLGETYPQPIVDHATARAEALAAFKRLRGADGSAER